MKRTAVAAVAVGLALAAVTPASATGPTGEIVYSTSGGGQALALTFDDGPSPVWTPQVLDLLREQKVRATFCLLGGEVVKYPELVRRIVAEGHKVCDHSLYHEDLGAKTPEAVRAELTATNAAIRQAAGDPTLPIPYFRAPFGSWGGTPAIAAEYGMSALAWTVDPRDWDGSPAAVIVERLRSQLYPTAVLLSHDGGGDRGPTLAAYRQLIPEWKAAGWRFDFPAVTGGPYPVRCTAPTWARNGTYTAGARVSHDGRVYQANWWTRSERPSGAPWVWSDLGVC
ncbi:polysaccharide deacetylase family protein [Actinokineospora sp. NBRC 105648]|uniref:polysaccharide deacetylase family protein n=1 Tax=Actinokineospora sp. NBRC 105648 TaxID=3032206 RepID=UPI002552DFDC|nr:polysaccharide deacetylase family protein [Actinokineospora sp. NBRC 105648]